jgi:NTE family protein/lysophospholipid hydrolase
MTTTIKDRYDILRNSPDLMRMDSAMLEELANHSGELTLQTNEKMLFNYENQHTVYIIVSGKLSFVLENHITGKQAIDEFEAGSLVGHFNARLSVKGNVSLVATEPTVLLSIENKTLTPLLDQSPSAQFQFDKTIRNIIHRGQFATYMSRLFGLYDPAGLKKLLGGIEWRSLNSGEILYREGDEGDSIYLILSGRMRATIDEGNGRHRLVTEMVSGETVGEVALLTRSERQSTLTAARDTVLARLSSTGFEKLTSSHPQIILRIARIVATRLRNQVANKAQQHQKGTTFVITPVHEGFDISEFVASFFETMKFTGSTACFTAQDIDKELDREGIANEPSTSIRNTDISQWLHKKEAAYENVILIADGPWSNWSERAIRQADHLLLVADFDSDVKQSEQEKKINALWDFSSHLKQSLILIHPADTTDISGTKHWLEERRIISFNHVRKEQSEDYARLSRILTGQANSLVLGGGGARGYAHIGVIRALEENGVTIDAVGGTSIGGIIAAAVALQYDSNRIFDLCSQYFRRFFDFTLPIVSLIKGRKIEKNLEGALGDKRIEDLFIPFFCVSTNLTRAEQVIHTRGSIADALRASMSLPAMVPPVIQSGDLLVDGGVLNNLPIDVMNDLYSGGKIIAVDISPKVDLASNESRLMSGSGLKLLFARLNPFRRKEYIPSIFDIISRSMTLAAVNKSMQTDEKSLASLYLLLSVEAVGTLEYERLQQIADLGYSSSINQITQWCRGNESN